MNFIANIDKSLSKNRVLQIFIIIIVVALGLLIYHNLQDSKASTKPVEVDYSLRNNATMNHVPSVPDATMNQLVKEDFAMPESPNPFKTITCNHFFDGC
jgi:hypothetical protein